MFLATGIDKEDARFDWDDYCVMPFSPGDTKLFHRGEGAILTYYELATASRNGVKEKSEIHQNRKEQGVPTQKKYTLTDKPTQNLRDNQSGL